MKKLIFILFSLLYYSGGFAQSYKSCLDGEMIRWSFLDQQMCSDPFFCIESMDIIAYGYLSINNMKYKKLYIDYYSFDYHDAEETNTNWQRHTPHSYYEWEGFFIRESEDASRLYIYDSIWGEEYLLSDMNLQEGETFQYDNLLSGERDAIVDEVYLKDGLKHIRCHFTNSEVHYIEPFNFIESVGADIWFTYPRGCKPYPFGLNCFQNQTTFYKNNGAMEYWNFADYPCGYYYCDDGDGTVSTPGDHYHIFIQEDKIEILFTSGINVDIAIYDMQGKLCHVENDLSGKNIVIPTSLLSKGVYILRIFDRQNLQANSKKIILQ